MAGVADAFRAMVRSIVGLPEAEGQAPLLLLLGRYSATVEAQNADGTVDVRPVDSRVPGAKNVKVRVSPPGVSWTVSVGASVLLGWIGGDPAQPYCSPDWDSGALVTKLTFADAAGDSLDISAGVVTIKIGGVIVFQASASSVGLGLVRSLPFLYQGSVDSMGVPVTNNPAASASIVKGG